MRRSKLSLLTLLVTLLAGLAVAAPAQALFLHTVAPGESLSSIAAADGLSVSALAAANGLSPSAQLLRGSSVAIPAQSGPSGGPLVTTATSTVGIDNDADGDETAAASAAPASLTSGSYRVLPGDTLTAVAARAGLSVQSLAAANGLDPAGVLLAGQVIRLSGSGVPSNPVATATTVGSPTSSAGAVSGGPYPTPEHVSAAEVGQVAAGQGAPGALAAAVGWQESGFNNDLVSSTGAVGVMQIEPGTWDWIQRSLNAGTALAPASAVDNVRGGSLMLRWLLNSTGGDPALAAAGYYQGLASVRAHGMYSDTQQYVQSVLSLERRFGGS